MKKFILDLIEKIKPKKEEVVKEYVSKEITEIEKEGNIFKIKDKVIVVGNEPGGFLIADIVGFWDNDGKWNNPMPQLIDERGKEYSTFGIMNHYSDDLVELLNTMEDLEQYNFLVREHGQLEEKYGIKYKTFNKLSIDNRTTKDNINGNTIRFEQHVPKKLKTIFYCCDCKFYNVVEVIDEYTIRLDTELSIAGTGPYFNIIK